MKARFKGPSGTGVIELEDNASVDALCKRLIDQTGIQEFSIKYGPPMAMRNLDMASSESVKSLGLHGETLTIVPEESSSGTATAAPARHTGSRLEQSTGQQRQAKSQQDPEDIVVPWPEREGTLRE